MVAIKTMPKLTAAQRSLLFKLGARTMDDEMALCDRLLKGRGPLASAQVLRRLGFAEFVKPGFFNGEYWRITPAGDTFATKLAMADADSQSE